MQLIEKDAFQVFLNKDALERFVNQDALERGGITESEHLKITFMKYDEGEEELEIIVDLLQHPFN